MDGIWRQFSSINLPDTKTKHAIFIDMEKDGYYSAPLKRVAGGTYQRWEASYTLVLPESNQIFMMYKVYSGTSSVWSYTYAQKGQEYNIARGSYTGGGFYESSVTLNPDSSLTFLYYTDDNYTHNNETKSLGIPFIVILLK